MLDLKASQVINLYYSNYKYFFSKPNVVGIAYGYKVTNGMNTCEPCIHVFVQKKIQANCLPSNGIIPPIYQGVKTDVIETGIFTLGNNPCNSRDNNYNCSNSHIPSPYEGRVRPIQSGWCVGGTDPEITGTIGYWGTDRKQVSKTYCILGTNSAFAYLNRYPIGTPIIQPSLAFDGKFPDDIIGSLLRFVPLNLLTIYEPPPPLEEMNVVNAAIASYVSIGEVELINPFIPPEGTWINGLAEPSLGMTAAFTGSSSGFQSRPILSLNAIIDVSLPNFQNAWFKDVTIMIQSPAGDSDDLGALVTTYPPINRQSKALGLLSAVGVSQKTYTLAFCSIQKIQELLDFNLLVAPEIRS